MAGYIFFVIVLVLSIWRFVEGGNGTKKFDHHVPHYDPLDMLRDMIDLSGLLSDKEEISPRLHMLVAGARLHESPHVDFHWEQYQRIHGKTYTNLEQQVKKRKWVENLIRIYQHNEDARKGEHSFYLGVNHMTDMGVREYIKKRAKLKHAGKAGSDEIVLSSRSKRNNVIPEELNWVDKGFITPAWDQGECGSCYAFSIASSAEGQYFRKTNEIINLSAQQLVDCSVVVGNRGCNGGSLRNTLRYGLFARGLMSESSYPYKEKQQVCHFRGHKRSVNITSFVILPEEDEVAMQLAVATKGPIACSVNASPYTFQLYHKGIYDDPNCSSKHVNHAMLIVGYTKDAWILKNWWGPEWGMEGYMLLRRGKNRCAVGKYAAYPVIGDDEDEDYDNHNEE